MDAGRRDAFADLEPIVERIIGLVDLDLLAALRETTSFRKRQEIARRARSLLAQQAVLDERLGPSRPSTGIGPLHPVVAEVATPFWSNEQYREAVNVAARAVNAHLQRKLGRKDVSEVELVRQAFSTNNAKDGEPRLRFPHLSETEEKQTWTSRHQGVREFGAGVFLAIRNVEAHADPTVDDLEPDYAAECLAALSLLTRWIDETVLDNAISVEDLMEP